MMHIYPTTDIDNTQNDYAHTASRPQQAVMLGFGVAVPWQAISAATSPTTCTIHGQG